MTDAEIAILLLSLKVSAVAILAAAPIAFAVAWLLARVQFEGMFQRVGEIFKQTFHESLSQFVKQFSRALPKLEPEEIQLRLMFSVGSFTFVAMNSKTICVGMKLPSVEQDPGVLTSRIVAFCTAGMEAPPARKPRARRKGSHL